jgi:hypothetical protein
VDHRPAARQLPSELTPYRQFSSHKANAQAADDDDIDREEIEDVGSFARSGTIAGALSGVGARAGVLNAASPSTHEVSRVPDGLSEGVSIKFDHQPAQTTG